MLASFAHAFADSLDALHRSLPRGYWAWVGHAHAGLVADQRFAGQERTTPHPAAPRLRRRPTLLLMT